jgi:hypothetical protein
MKKLVGNEFFAEHAGFDVMRRSQHAIFLGFFETQADGEEG